MHLLAAFGGAMTSMPSHHLRILAPIEKDIDQNDIWTNPAWDGLMV